MPKPRFSVGRWSMRSPSIHSSPSLAGIKPANDVEGSGFSAAARTEERHELSAPDRQGEVVEDGLRPEALGDPEPQRAELRAHWRLIFCAPTSRSQRSKAYCSLRTSSIGTIL